MVSTGQMDRRIEFQRGTPVTDAAGGDTLTWSQFGKAWAAVSFGSGQERREAAQESAVQAATFIVAWTNTRAEIRVSDRILALSAEWDITSIAPVGRNAELHFTATRRV